MSLRQTLANLSVGHNLLAALLVLLATVLLVVNLVFVSAVYWIARQSVDPQALTSIGRLLSNPALSHAALASDSGAKALLDNLSDFSALRAAALYGRDGQRLAVLQHDAPQPLPEHFEQVPGWLQDNHGAAHLVKLNQPGEAPGHLLLVAASELSPAFYQGIVTA